MDAPGSGCLGILGRVWIGAVYGALGFDVYGKMMAGCRMNDSILECFCTFTIWDGIIFVHAFAFYVFEVYAEAVYSRHLVVLVLWF